MSFIIRTYRRFPISFPSIYQVGDFEGHGTVWNCSLTGWRFSGNLPLREGEIFSLTVALPSGQRIYVVAAIVCWVRGSEYGAETLSVDDESRNALEKFLDQQLHDWVVSHW